MRVVHHQLAEIRKAVAAHQVVAFIGARGVGKTRAAEELDGVLSNVGMKVIRILITPTQALSGTLRPLASALGVASDDLISAKPPARPLRVLFERCEALHACDWAGPFQDQLRALAGRSDMRGAFGVVLFGRPHARTLLGGAGSPLLNLGASIYPRPYSIEDLCDACSVDERAARAIRSKTGGNPHLSGVFSDELGGSDLSNMGIATRRVIATESTWLEQSVLDHGVRGAKILGEVLQAQRPIARATLIGRWGHHTPGQANEEINLLAGSGFLQEDEHGVALGASLLREAPVVRNRVIELRGGERAPFPVDEPLAHSGAAALMYRVENRLRDRVARWLWETDEDWWPKRIQDPTVVAQAEERWQDDDAGRRSGEDQLHQLMFVALGELFAVMEKDSNWREVFKVRFDINIETFKDARFELIRVRNRIAHNRPVRYEDVGRLHDAARILGVDD